MARICSWSSSLKERVSYKFWKQYKNSLHKFHGRLTRCISVSPCETWWNLVEVRSFTRRHYQSNSCMLVKLVKAFPLSFQSSFPYEGEDVSLASQIRLHEIKKRLHVFLKTSACFLNSCWNFYSCTFKKNYFCKKQLTKNALLLNIPYICIVTGVAYIFGQSRAYQLDKKTNRLTLFYVQNLSMPL